MWFDRGLNFDFFLYEIACVIFLFLSIIKKYLKIGTETCNRSRRLLCGWRVIQSQYKIEKIKTKNQQTNKQNESIHCQTTSVLGKNTKSYIISPAAPSTMAHHIILYLNMETDLLCTPWPCGFEHVWTNCQPPQPLLTFG